MRTYYRGSRATRPSDEWASSFEAHTIASRLRAGLDPLCAHNFVTDAVHRDRTLDNNAVQAAGQAACKAAQLADLAAKAK
jgi:hypothetical protein